MRGQWERSRFLCTSLLLWFYVTGVWIDITVTHMTLWSNSTFPTLEEHWEQVVGGRLPKALRNTNPNRVDYEGHTELSPLGLPQLSVGLGANSGEH